MENSLYWIGLPCINKGTFDFDFDHTLNIIATIVENVSQKGTIFAKNKNLSNVPALPLIDWPPKVPTTMLISVLRAEEGTTATGQGFMVYARVFVCAIDQKLKKCILCFMGQARYVSRIIYELDGISRSVIVLWLIDLFF